MTEGFPKRVRRCGSGRCPQCGAPNGVHKRKASRRIQQGGGPRPRWWVLSCSLPHPRETICLNSHAFHSQCHLQWCSLTPPLAADSRALWHPGLRP